VRRSGTLAEAVVRQIGRERREEWAQQIENVTGQSALAVWGPARSSTGVAWKDDRGQQLVGRRPLRPSKWNRPGSATEARAGGRGGYSSSVIPHLPDWAPP
jgi:hypothetical protein